MPKRRGNNQGSVYKLKSGKWRGAVTLGTWLDEKGNRHRQVVSRNFDTKTEAVKWVATPEARMEPKKNLTLKELHELWEATYNGSESAVSVYKAAWGKLSSLWGLPLSRLNIDLLQGCIDGCGAGKQTKTNIITLLRFMYGYGMPRGYIPDGLNLSLYLKNSGGQSVGKKGIPLEYVDKIPALFGKVPFAEYVYCHCYLGFRPGELRKLDVRNYDRKEKAIVGGSKTDAGKDRPVTISPKIQPIIDELVRDKIAGPMFCNSDGKALTVREYKQIFDAVLEAIELDNPQVEINGRKYTTYTPHSCRHTFATLMAKTNGEIGARMALMGHASEKVLHDYEDTRLDGLREITDKL